MKSAAPSAMSASVIHRKAAPRGPAPVAARWTPSPHSSGESGSARCACGGVCPRCERSGLLSQPGDRSEVEADRTADAVMRSPSSAPSPISRAAAAPSPDTARLPTGVAQTLRSAGEPLDAATRAQMEPRFGQDFSRVRVFRGAQAEHSAEAVNARAYTVGSNLVFGAGQYAPGSSAGQRLLAHELAHVVQQGRTSGAAGGRLIHRATKAPPMQILAESAAKFSQAVESNLIDEKTPTTAREKSVDVNVETTAHDQAVVNIVNAAIDAAAEDSKATGPVTEYELLRNALFNHVTPYRSTHGPKISQNLVLRDVDHYLVGRIQEWRRELPLESEPPGPTQSALMVGLGEKAADKYDQHKRESFQANPHPDAKDAKSSEDANRLPASAPGGRFWATVGGRHLLDSDHPEDTADPAKLKITLTDIQNARRLMKLGKQADIIEPKYVTQARGGKSPSQVKLGP
ncbi:MAG TPA: DUF4157 domain-containing protein [Opitutaceae bacterium]|jgi:hypothetical protein|nr:DUF4157 domain-containing protein [Opitutaceae bacterium]